MDRRAEVRAREGLDGGRLKLVAILAMAIDHIAFAFVPQGTLPAILMHTVGRITGPVMFYMAAEGCHYTRSMGRYALRLLIFAAISYFPFLLFSYGGDWGAFRLTRLNVLYTILLGVLAVWVGRRVRPLPLKILLIGALSLLSVPGDWGITGFFMILTFSFYWGDFKNQAYGYALLVLFDALVIHMFTRPVFDLIYEGAVSLDWDYYRYSVENLGLFLPLLLLRRYNGAQGAAAGRGKWLFYWFYPAHLLALGVIRWIAGV